MWAVCSAVLIRACCAGPLGAVRLLERPSWFSAAPCRSTVACMDMQGRPQAIGHLIVIKVEVAAELCGVQMAL